MVPTLPWHLLALLEEGLRDQDEAELKAAGSTPLGSLFAGYKAGWPHCFTILVEGTPAAVFGVVDGAVPGLGVPWMLGTDRLLGIGRDLMVQGEQWIVYLNHLYPTLENWVDERNLVSIAWLERMGFDFPGETIVVGPTTFRRFTRCVSPSASPQP